MNEPSEKQKLRARIAWYEKRVVMLEEDLALAEGGEAIRNQTLRRRNADMHERAQKAEAQVAELAEALYVQTFETRDVGFMMTMAMHAQARKDLCDHGIRPCMMFGPDGIHHRHPTVTPTR